jgi:hypothetical protein
MYSNIVNKTASYRLFFTKGHSFKRAIDIHFAAIAYICRQENAAFTSMLKTCRL